MLISVRASQSTVKQQYDRDTCVPFAVTALHEHAHDVVKCCNKRADIDLSEEFLFFHCKKRDGLGPNSEGTTILAASASLATEGQSLESLCPYRWALSKPGLAAPTSRARADGKARLLYGLRLLDRSLRSIRDALSLGRPVVAVLDWYSNAYVTRLGGIEMPGPKDRFLGRHAVLTSAVTQNRPLMVT